MAKRKPLRLVVGGAGEPGTPTTDELLGRVRSDPDLAEFVVRMLMAEIDVRERLIGVQRTAIEEQRNALPSLLAALRSSSGLHEKIRPVIEQRVNAYRGRAQAARKSNAGRMGLRTDERFVKRLVKRLDLDEHGRRRSDREILRLLQDEHDAPLGRGGNALAKIAKFRHS